ncbi:MAG: tetratricopeptide repeat protein [Candidatus Peribacteraceae bacterium]
MHLFILIIAALLVACTNLTVADEKFQEAITLLQGGTVEAVQRGRDAMELAAALGSGDAALTLGYMHLKGQAGYVADAGAALTYFTKAATAGNTDAMYNTGLAYLRGNGTEVDFTEAFRWFEKAAYAGDAGAQYNTAVMLLNGEGADPDPVMAMVWFYLSDEQGYEGAKDGGKAARQKMTDEQAAGFEDVLEATKAKITMPKPTSQRSSVSENTPL